MAETLGSLCDKLTIVKLKQWHSDDDLKLKSLNLQEQQLTGEIDDFLEKAVAGEIPKSKITFAANKVYEKKGNSINEVEGTIGFVFSELALVNCKIWHEQEKVYFFDKVAAEDKDSVIKQLAILNLERNYCIENIDKTLSNILYK
jgi:hypothetical protein